MPKPQWIVPQWAASPKVRALVTTRNGGFSEGNYTSLNFALGVNDKEQHVFANRAVLRYHAKLPKEPVWLEQVHGKRVLEMTATHLPSDLRADGAVSFSPQQVCCVLTADCFPVFFCDRAATRVGISHVGWRGFVAGILEQTIEQLRCDPTELLAWIGPGISMTFFQVGDDVRAQFINKNKDFSLFFLPDHQGHWHADLLQCIVMQLRLCNVQNISGGEYCTYAQADTFYSYRQHANSGRMASLIWLEEND